MSTTHTKVPFKYQVGFLPFPLGRERKTWNKQQQKEGNKDVSLSFHSYFNVNEQI